MMKLKTILLPHRLLTFVVGMLLSVSAFAQQIDVKGHVTDATGEAVIGATVRVDGTQIATVTDFDGNFTLKASKDATITVTFIGYQDLKVKAAPTLELTMKDDSQVLENVVVIGYGTARKSDLTGSVSTIKSEDFNGGVISSSEQLINGKVAGVQIMSNSGSPTSGNTIRIRGGASLNASNDPLIVVDGVPIESGGISGSQNPLSMINPADIESMTVLKDASSTAIYGSRASNGVLLITTKKGGKDKLRVSFNTTNSLSYKTETADMLGADDFRNVVNTYGTAQQKALLGNANTNWLDEIFQTAFSTDNNVSVSGRAGFLPFRVSLGYTNQQGILKTDKMERYSAAIVLNPSFFDEHLRLTLNAKGTFSKNRFADAGNIYNASSFNPTVPIYSGNDRFGGWWEAISPSGLPEGTANPVAKLDYVEHTGRVGRFIGNFDVDYKMHFLPDLKAHISLGIDYAKGHGVYYSPAGVAMNYSTDGTNNKYGPQENINKLFTAYLNYSKYFEKAKSNVDITAGYDYQMWINKTPEYDNYNVYGEVQGHTSATDQRHALVSWYGRVNYSFADRYLLTATLRADGTSRFSKDNRWGYFPSVGLGWRVNEEKFMKNVKWLDNLKLRVSYGETGQQEIGNNYGYMSIYHQSNPGAYYLMGDTYIPMLRPSAYIEDLKWESTRSWNYGFDFSVLNNRLSGSFDFYTRETRDLLAEVPVPAGANFNSRMTTNVGNVDSKGVEFTINATPIQTKYLTWDLSFNATWQTMKVKNLSVVPGTSAVNTLVGPTYDSYAIQVLSEGYEPYMFYLYHQLYDEAGKPIEGAYADLNGDGKIDNDDRYRVKSPAPDWIFGFSTSLTYKKWRLSTSLRANVGNYVYNGNAMNMGASEVISFNTYQLNNLHADFLNTGFKTRQRLSDYYLQNASFLKMDNLSLGYNFGKVSSWISNLSLTATVQNVFTITKYDGCDPEVPSGNDKEFYPRPRTYSLSIGIDF